MVDEQAWQRELEALRVRKGYRELDAIAAQRRRTLMFARCRITFWRAKTDRKPAEIFDGKSQLIVYSHMWSPG